VCNKWHLPCYLRLLWTYCILEGEDLWIHNFWCSFFSPFCITNFYKHKSCHAAVDACWNVMADAQKPDFVIRRNGRVHLNRRRRQFSRLLAAELCSSAVVMVVMLDTPCSEVVWRVLVTHSMRQVPLHFPSRASPGAITFQLESTISWPSLCEVCFCTGCTY